MGCGVGCVSYPSTVLIIPTGDEWRRMKARSVTDNFIAIQREVAKTA